MPKTLNKYAGFIDGLKANNISTNKTSLDVYSQQLQIVFANLLSKDNLLAAVRSNIELAKQTIEVAEKENNALELINLYIKVGDILKTVTPDLKLISPKDLKTAVINYLNIAKHTKDTRVDNLAIEIAKDADA